MAKGKVFISYSHKDKSYRDQLVPFLRAIPSVADVVWVDEAGIAIGDQFHDSIQQALAEARVGILLLSNYFFASDYINKHELPLLIESAQQRDVKLGFLYLTSIPNAALERTMELSGQQQTINLTGYQGANGPNNPLDKLSSGERNEIYAKLAGWVAEQLEQFKDRTANRFHAPRRQQGPRYELAVTIRKQSDHWRHSFSLPQAPDFLRPDLDCPASEMLSGYEVTGEDLFQLLFGSDEHTSSEILGAAFDRDVADPTRYPLRVRLLTDTERLYTLPWTDIAYRGRPLHQVGWTVELHAENEPGFPEYPSHTCLFPAKVVLLASRDTAGAAHFQDLQYFFQRGWPQNPTPVLVNGEQALRRELGVGSARLVYYYGPASRDGLLLEGADVGDKYLPWAELAELLQKSRSVSLLFLNLLGEPSHAAVPAGRVLLQGAKAVLLQCSERAGAAAAAKAALAGLRDVFTGEQLDPVMALHRHQHGLAAAWTRYSSWRTVAPQRLEHPDLVDLLLDRRSQRAELLQAKEDFYTFRTRRIYHAMAFGSRGCRVNDFPNTAAQHLRLYGKKDREVVIQQMLQVTPSLSNAKRIDDAVRRQLHIDPRGSFVNALLRQEANTGSDFWFLMLGWTLSGPLADATTGAELIRVVTDWCSTCLGEDIAAVEREINVRVISIFAIETPSDEIAAELEDTVAELSERYDNEDAFHVGELERLAGVRRQDLTHYFKDTQICHCDDRYRRDFPRLLLGDRAEMPFDEAVRTIKRGHSDNWGNLFEELKTLTEAGDWPPRDSEPYCWEPGNDE